MIASLISFSFTRPTKISILPCAKSRCAGRSGRISVFSLNSRERPGLQVTIRMTVLSHGFFFAGGVTATIISHAVIMSIQQHKYCMREVAANNQSLSRRIGFNEHLRSHQARARGGGHKQIGTRSAHRCASECMHTEGECGWNSSQAGTLERGDGGAGRPL